MPDSVDTDLPLARDGQGRLYVPGTALAGPMRAWMAEAFDETAVNEVLGFQSPRGSEGGQASRVAIDDGLVQLPEGCSEEVWDSVSVDRESGTAAPRGKFDRAILPRGTRIALAMSIDLPRDAPRANRVQAIVGHFMQALQEGKIGLGAANTRGLGRVRLDAKTLQVTDEDWLSRAGVIAWLREQAPRRSVSELMQADPSLHLRPSAYLIIHIEWQPRGPLMVKAARDGIGADTLPFVSATGHDRLAMTLPGSGIKGSLRSQAERIVRTVLGWDDARWRDLEHGERQRVQVDMPLVEELFGTAKRPDPAVLPEITSDDPNAPPVLGRGAIEVDTCYETRASLRQSAWAAIAQAPSVGDILGPGQRSLYDELRAAGVGRGQTDMQQAYFQQAFHVGVDRWTGGASEGLLFSTLEPFNTAWEPIRLTLKLRRLASALREPALALLLLLIRDLSNNRIALGFGANRGYGSMTVRAVRFSGGGDEFGWLNGQELPAGDLATLGDQPGLLRLNAKWADWVRRNAEQQVAV
jgi:CRISPR/Cas system CSM-associated protein Csm3 (group 7 of RAMP superfamily)